MKTDLKPYFDTRNINAVNPSYLYRSGKPCNLDFQVANMLGKEAVETIISGIVSPVFLTISKRDNDFTIEPYQLDNVKNIEQLHRFVDDSFYCSKNLMITKRGEKYLNMMMEEIPLNAYGI